MNDTNLLNKSADNIRVLTAAMVEKAKSGHPGGAMGGADFINVLYSEFLVYDPADPKYTLSFDLLFRGMEITTGGQRIHDYNMLLDKMEQRGMTDEGMEQYLSAFKYGMPPHGGLGIGLERLTMKLTGDDNVRETTLFPRDMSRLEP